MFTTVRIFPSETHAREAANRLADARFEAVSVLAVPADQAEMAVRSAVADGRLPGSHAGISIRSLKSGRAVVAVPTPFGAGQLAIEILQACGAVDTASLPPHMPRDPTPFSDFLGIPALTDFEPVSGLSKNPYVLGEPKLSKKAAPFSSLLGLKTLTTPKKNRTSSFGLPLLVKSAAPFSSMFRIPTLSRSRGSASLFENPAPFSSIFGIPLLTKRDRKR